MEHNYYDIFNKLDKLEQQSKDHENKLNDMKQFYEDKLNNMKQEYENKIKELNMIVKIDTVERTQIFKSENIVSRLSDEQIYILEPTYTDNQESHFNDYLNKELSWYKSPLPGCGYVLDIIYKTEPLILTIKNNVAHLYGAIFSCANYIIPSYIKTNSQKPRLLYNTKMYDICHHVNNDNIVVLFNNILTLNCSTGNNDYIMGSKYSTIKYRYLTIDIHFNL